jgi:hypothetical protein
MFRRKCSIPVADLIIQHLASENRLGQNREKFFAIREMFCTYTNNSKLTKTKLGGLSPRATTACQLR